MATPINMRFGGVNLTSGDSGDSAVMPDALPFRLLVVGNLHGNRPSRVGLAQRKPVFTDRDNFDEILAKHAPSVTLPNPVGGGELTIAFRELDDFDPDRLFDKLPIFDQLRDLRRNLAQPSTFAQAAARVREWAKIPGETPTTPPSSPKGVSAADLMDEMFEQRRAETTPELPGTSDWQQFLNKIVQPQLVEKSDPRQGDYEAVVEEAISAQMRAILHHPAFQSLEAAWRGLYLLVKHLPTDENLRIFAFDVSVDEWRQDLGADDPTDMLFVRMVIQRAAENPWAAFISLETFGNSVADLELVAQMTLLASRMKTPVIAGGTPKLAGCPSLVAHPDPREWKLDPALGGAWEMIRGLEAAKYLGLVVPRFVLRLPYGDDAAKTERFAFEESPNHEQYLWAPGSVLVAMLLGQAFAESGWRMSPDDHRQVNGLPVHIYDDEGERAMKPCAEVHLRETALEALVEAGLMTLISTRDRDSVRLARFQSAAAGTEPLAGRWSE